MTREEKAQFCIDNPKKSPAFQFYPDNWFGSRHVSAMSIKQRGIHATLIFAAWLEPSCGVPEGEECLSARIQENDSIDCKIVLKYCWFLFEGYWFNERLLNERIKQVDISKTRKEVGSMGGRPKKSKVYKNKPIGLQKDSKPKANETKSRVEDEIEIENEIEEVIEDKKEDKKQPTGSELIFDEFRKKYPGTKRGNSTEYENFCKKHRDHSSVLPLLLPALVNQSSWRLEMSGAGMFVPGWKNLQTWINQRCWEMEKPVIEKNNDFGNRSQSGRKLNEYEIGAANKYDGL